MIYTPSVLTNLDVLNTLTKKIEKSSSIFVYFISSQKSLNLFPDVLCLGYNFAPSLILWNFFEAELNKYSLKNFASSFFYRTVNKDFEIKTKDDIVREIYTKFATINTYVGLLVSGKKNSFDTCCVCDHNRNKYTDAYINIVTYVCSKILEKNK